MISAGRDVVGMEWLRRGLLRAFASSREKISQGPVLDPRAHHRQTAAMDETGPDIAAMSFEQALKALEDVVRQLESGDVPLDESISLYERGEALRRHCQARLDAAQARIERIVAGPDGKASAAVPFDAG
jgi:exodeoxyribonuclease VII small subunit